MSGGRCRGRPGRGVPRAWWGWAGDAALGPAAGEQAVLVAEGRQRHGAAFDQAGDQGGVGGGCVGGCAGDFRELAASHGEGAGQGAAVDVGVAGHAARFGQGCGVEAVAEADDPGSGGNDGHVGEAGGLVAVEIDAAVVDSAEDLEGWGQAVAAGEIGADGAERLPGRGEGRDQALPVSGGDDGGGAAVGGVPDVGLRAEDRDFGCGDAA